MTEAGGDNRHLYHSGCDRAGNGGDYGFRIAGYCVAIVLRLIGMRGVARRTSAAVSAEIHFPNAENPAAANLVNRDWSSSRTAVVAPSAKPRSANNLNR
jgi:hypothetical protein